MPDLVICERDDLEYYQQDCQVLGLEDIPILLVLGVPLAQGSDQCLQEGAAGYLFHPFSAIKLLATRDAVLRGQLYCSWKLASAT